MAPDGRQRLQRLRWLCRRGMKELDVLLEAFLAREAPRLEQGAFPEFETLLACEDDQLWDWLQGRASAPDTLASLVHAIRL